MLHLEHFSTQCYANRWTSFRIYLWTDIWNTFLVLFYIVKIENYHTEDAKTILGHYVSQFFVFLLVYLFNCHCVHVKFTIYTLQSDSHVFTWFVCQLWGHTDTVLYKTPLVLLNIIVFWGGDTCYIVDWIRLYLIKIVSMNQLWQYFF